MILHHSFKNLTAQPNTNHQWMKLFFLKRNTYYYNPPSIYPYFINSVYQIYSQKFNGHDHQHSDQQQHTCQQLYDSQSSLTVDQSTQTIQVEEYEKTCFDCLRRVELLNFFCNRMNR